MHIYGLRFFFLLPKNLINSHARLVSSELQWCGYQEKIDYRSLWRKYWLFKSIPPLQKKQFRKGGFFFAIAIGILYQRGQ
jgi:hypothetical protein